MVAVAAPARLVVRAPQTPLVLAVMVRAQTLQALQYRMPAVAVVPVVMMFLWVTLCLAVQAEAVAAAWALVVTESQVQALPTQAVAVAAAPTMLAMLQTPLGQVEAAVRELWLSALPHRISQTQAASAA